MKLRLVCCPLCGEPLFRDGSGGRVEYQKRNGIEVAISHYPRGLGSYREKQLSWKADLCVKCSTGAFKPLDEFIRKVMADAAFFD